MGFWRKFVFFIISITTLVALQIFATDIGSFELTVCNRELSIGLYLVSLAVFIILFVCFLVKSFFASVVSLFAKGRSTNDPRSISSVARLVVSDDYDFPKLFENVPSEWNDVKVALALKRNLMADREFDLTGISCVDIYLMKRSLQRELKRGASQEAIDLASTAIRNYPSEVSVIEDEIIEVAMRALRNNLKFEFDPTRFRYNLTRGYIERYLTSLAMLRFELENVFEKRLKILERAHKDFPSNLDVLTKLLDFAFEKYSEKQILELIGETISINPDGGVAKYLLKLKLNDLFEKVQSILSSIPDSNVDKIWILLKLAIQKGFVSRIKSLFSSLIIHDNSENVLEFYIKNYDVLSTIPEVTQLMNKRILDGNKL